MLMLKTRLPDVEC